MSCQASLRPRDSPSRLRLIIEERKRRELEGSLHSEEQELEEEPPILANLSAILLPKEAPVYLNKQAAIKNDYILR